MKRICAWCLADMGEIAPEQPGVTHGICESCKAKLMAAPNGHNPDGAVVSPPFSCPVLLSEEICPYCGTRHLYGDCQYV